MAPVGGQRSAFEDGAAGPDQAGDRRDALSQGGRAVRPSTGATAQRGRGLSTLFPPRHPPLDKLCSAGGRSGSRPAHVLAAITLVGRCRAAVDAVPASGAVGRVHEGTW